LCVCFFCYFFFFCWLEFFCFWGGGGGLLGVGVLWGVFFSHVVRPLPPALRKHTTFTASFTSEFLLLSLNEPRPNHTAAGSPRPVLCTEGISIASHMWVALRTLYCVDHLPPARFRRGKTLCRTRLRTHRLPRLIRRSQVWGSNMNCTSRRWRPSRHRAHDDAPDR